MFVVDVAVKDETEKYNNECNRTLYIQELIGELYKIAGVRILY